MPPCRRRCGSARAALPVGFRRLTHALQARTAPRCFGPVMRRRAWRHTSSDGRFTAREGPVAQSTARALHERGETYAAPDEHDESGRPQRERRARRRRRLVTTRPVVQLARATRADGASVVQGTLSCRGHFSAIGVVGSPACGKPRLVRLVRLLCAIRRVHMRAASSTNRLAASHGAYALNAVATPESSSRKIP